MFRTLALIASLAAAGLVAQTAAHAARQDAIPSSDAVDLLRTPQKPGAAHIPAFHGLMSASESEVTGRLGKPDVSRAEGAGAMWTYRLPDCALFVFFRRSAPEGLKVSGAAAGPRSRGRNPPPVNECVTEALGRRSVEGPGR